ncbi:phosphatidate cytidylyltransferase [Burkholderia sp. L27(2015)]|uniref:phosphatidate cytidylyltransferase n=1 Tax=Burkholderia sp. L27(2015) TaxID=1641858 RepID=UPI00131B6D45|nr:phosphatidate cytidylyltransferase [Burkholderia sp. L27(2015)]
MLRTRVLTALVLLAVFLPVTLFAPVGVFAALIGLVITFAAWEWARLLGLSSRGTVLYAAVTAMALLLSTRLFYTSTTGFYKAAAIFWIVGAPYMLLRKPTLVRGAWRAFLLVAGVVLLIACWYALRAARVEGVAFVLSLMLVVWCADIGAYFAGKAFGRHKLAIAISPGKTWEGAIGGWLLVMVLALAAMVAGAAGVSAGASAGGLVGTSVGASVGMSAGTTTGTFAPTLFSVYASTAGMLRALIGITLLVVFSVVGDLFESLLKRQAGVKDSSGLLPGHGGVLDRIDALLPVLPLAMLLIGPSAG